MMDVEKDLCISNVYHKRCLAGDLKAFGGPTHFGQIGNLAPTCWTFSE